MISYLVAPHTHRLIVVFTLLIYNMTWMDKIKNHIRYNGDPFWYDEETNKLYKIIKQKLSRRDFSIWSRIIYDKKLQKIIEIDEYIWKIVAVTKRYWKRSINIINFQYNIDDIIFHQTEPEIIDFIRWYHLHYKGSKKIELEEIFHYPYLSNKIDWNGSLVRYIYEFIYDQYN